MKMISLVAAIGLLTAPMASAATLYATDQNATNTLVAVDTDTNIATVIGNIGFNITSLAVNAAGDLFGLTFSDLVSINPVTGAGTLIGNTGLSAAEGLTFLADGRLIGGSSGSGELRVIDTNTGAGTLLGNITPGFDIDGLTVAPVDVMTSAGLLSAGTIFGVDSGNIYAVDPNTLASTLLGNNNAAQEGIAFDEDGSLYAGGVGGDIVQLDLMTMATVNTLNAGFGGFVGGLASATPFPSAVPLPAGLPLILSGLGALAFIRRRRRAA